MAARAARADQTQDGVLARLSGPRPQHVVHLALGNAFVATVTPAQQAELATDAAVASVVPDTSVRMASAAAPAGGRKQFARHVHARKRHLQVGRRTIGASPAVVSDPFQTCPTDPAQPLARLDELAVRPAARYRALRAVATRVGPEIADVRAHAVQRRDRIARLDRTHGGTEIRGPYGDRDPRR